MKKALLLFAFSCFSNLYAQESDMFSGKLEWDFSVYDAMHESRWDSPYYAIYDESRGLLKKNGKTYHKVYHITILDVDENGKSIYALFEPSAGIREEGGKVFADYDSYMALTNNNITQVEGELPFQMTGDGEILLYDFTVGVGDRYPASETCAPIYVSDVETVTTLDGKERKLITLDNGLQLLEGLGCLNFNGLLLHYLYTSGNWFYDYEGNGIFHELCIFYKNDEAVYIKDKKCTIPTISYDNGKLVFGCNTPGAEYVYEIKCTDAGSGRGSEVSLSQTYEIRVRATLDGYEDSDEAVATIGWRNGRPVMEGFSSVTMDGGDGNADVNGDGKVDVADIATVISVMAGQQPE